MRILHRLTALCCVGASDVTGFVASSQKSCGAPWVSRASSSRHFVSASPSSPSLPTHQRDEDSSIEDSTCPYRDTYHLNKALRKLASLQGDLSAKDSSADAADSDSLTDHEDIVTDRSNQPSSKSPFTTESFATVIARATACQAEWELYRHHPRVTPDLFSFNTVLKAWSRCAQFLADHRNDKAAMTTAAAAMAGTDVLLSGSAAAAINGPATIYTAQEAAQRAVDLLLAQEADAQIALKQNATAQVVVPNEASYNICMDAWSKSRRPDSPEQVERLFERLQSSPILTPTLLSYNALIDAWAHSDRPDRIDRVLELWKDIEQSDAVDPSVWTYNAILYAYSRAAQQSYIQPQQQQQDSLLATERMNPHAAAKESLAILTRMKTRYAATNNTSDRPDIMTYSIILEALARCGSPDMTQKAEELLDETKRLSYLQPTAYTYSGVLAAWARTKLPDACDRADALLKEVVDKKMANTKAFTTTMQAWSRSESPKKAARCLELLKQMKELKAAGNNMVSPDAFAYQIAIDTCATVNTGDAARQNAALRIAFAVFKSMQMDPDVPVTEQIYCSLLNAVARLIPPGEERSNVAKAVFEKAAAAKQVDARVIRALQQGADATTVQQVLAATGHEQQTIVRKGPPPPSTASSAWQRRIA